MNNLGLDISAKMMVREAMSSPVISVKENEDLVQVANKMREQRVGAVIVLNRSGNPVGIVTERDIVTRVVADGLDPNMIVASKVMSSPLKMVEPDLELMDAMRMMDRENIRRLGVIYKGELVGVITDRSIIRLVPTIMDIMKEQKEIMVNTVAGGASLVGYCDNCEMYSNDLREIDGDFLCEECRLDL
ncbi:CBS domain-containing protein [Candidatus Bathyarchaeota archaeon]|nr:CBS domain-containing protein [Candidatus Bathyarchaeota archaeon]